MTSTDYGSWQALAKAQAVEQRVDALTAGNSQGYLIVSSWANGWGVYSSRSVGLKKVDQNTAVRVTGQFYGGTVTDGTAVFYVGSDTSYYPGRVEAVTIGFSGAAGNSNVAPYLEFGSNGWVAIYGGGGSTGGHWTINGEYPLDTS